MICNIKSCSYSICGICNNMNDFDCEYKDYRAIGTTEECRKAVELIEKIKDIIREEEHYSVSNSFENPHPNKADYDAVHTDKFNRIWKVISEEMSN